MDAKELRLGNYVKDSKSGIYKVLAIANPFCIIEPHFIINKVTGSCLEGDVNLLNPIPLDEDLLNKIKSKMNGDCWVIECLWIQWYDDNQKRIWINGNYVGIIHLQYLHELQNLIYSLTGKELLVKM